ncbi:hypothetical protein LR48_Vigan06g086800 [Vigna angularis]|uniref:rRNA methyltransferase 2, mitochondrial n=1 Tax=Phaseolus angularis TaxID=3914 RepID=A0A0L9USL4_PHAAN|nr:hypothetical protein LR48_Vigan06g086800 [Vigna angularis]
MGVGGTAYFFYKEAQRLSYVARSAFKLLQIQVCAPDLDRGATILDLGCALGGWLQVACQSLGPFHGGGSILGVNTKKVKVLLQVSILGFRPSLAGFDFWIALCRLKIVDEDEWRLREVAMDSSVILENVVGEEDFAWSLVVVRYRWHGCVVVVRCENRVLKIGGHVIKLLGE